jgi:hypothetical protein
MCTTRSNRSTSARESFPPYAASFCGGAGAAELHSGDLPVGDPAANRPLREAELVGDLGDGQKTRQCVCVSHADTMPIDREDVPTVW